MNHPQDLEAKLLAPVDIVSDYRCMDIRYGSAQVYKQEQDKRRAYNKRYRERKKEKDLENDASL